MGGLGKMYKEICLLQMPFVKVDKVSVGEHVAAAAKALEGKVAYEVWERLPDGRTVVRFATSWATTQEQIDELASLLP